MNHTLREAGDRKHREMLWEEKRPLPKNNLIDYTDQVCIRHPVSSNHLNKRLVKGRIKLTDEIETWLNYVKSSATENVGLERVRHAGAFMLKTAWGTSTRTRAVLPSCAEVKIG